LRVRPDFGSKTANIHRKPAKIPLLASWPLFFVTYIIFNIFFSYLSEEKKWESGQKTRKPLGRNGFSLATFENKSGQKVGKWPVFRYFRPYFHARF
jgi:hypothetical protein